MLGCSIIQFIVWLQPKMYALRATHVLLPQGPSFLSKVCLFNDEFRRQGYAYPFCNHSASALMGTEVKVKVKFNLEQPTKFLRGNTFFNLVVGWGGLSTSCPGRFTPGKDPVFILQEAGWASGLVWTGVEKSCLLRDSITGPSNP
jgi:hypothetical protein